MHGTDLGDNGQRKSRSRGYLTDESLCFQSGKFLQLETEFCVMQTETLECSCFVVTNLAC